MTKQAITVDTVWTAATEAARGSRKLAKVARELVAVQGFETARETCYQFAREQIEAAGNRQDVVDARKAAYAALRKAFSRINKAAKEAARDAATLAIKDRKSEAEATTAARDAAHETAAGAVNTEEAAEIVAKVAAELKEHAERSPDQPAPDVSTGSVQRAWDTLSAAIIHSEGKGKQDAYAALEKVAAFLNVDISE